MPILSTEEKKIKRIEGAVSTTVLKEQPGRTSMSEGQSRLAIIDGNVTDVKKVGDELFQKRIFKSFDEEARTILNTEDEITVRHKFTGEPIFEPGFQSESFSSGFAGSGYRINKDTAADFSSPNTAYNIEIDNMIIRGTLSVYELLIQQIRATNGSIFVTSAAKVTSSSGLSASSDAGTIDFDDPSGKSLTPFADGDIIMMQRVDPGATVAQNADADAGGVVKKLVYKVNGTPSGVRVTVESAGFNNLSYPIEGDDFVRIGNDGSTSNRDGVIYLTSDDSNAPYIDIKSEIESYSDWYGDVPKVRLGNLAGITYDGASLTGEGFGLYSENVFLTGKITATSGYIGNGSSGFTVNSTYIGNGKTAIGDSSAGIYLGTNGIGLGANSPFQVSNAGVITSTSGTIGGWSLSSGYIEKDGTRLNDGSNNGYLGIGVTAYDANDGILLGEVSSGVYKFSIKNSDGSKYLRYTDSAFEIAAGNFSLDSSGDITATNVDLTGDITATSGTFTGTVNASGGTFTGYVSAGNMKMGLNVNSTYDGIYIDSNDYWYDNGNFSLGNGGVTWNGSTLAVAGQITSNSASSSWTNGSLTGGSIGGSDIDGSTRIIVGDVVGNRMEIKPTDDLATTWIGLIEEGDETQAPWRLLANGYAFFGYDGIQFKATGEVELLCDYPEKGDNDNAMHRAGLTFIDMNDDNDESGKNKWNIAHKDGLLQYYYDGSSKQTLDSNGRFKHQGWTGFTFNTGWANLGGDYQTGAYTKDSIGRVNLRGLVVRNLGSATLITTLASGYRPTARKIFASISADAICRIDILTNGTVYLQAGGDATNYVSLDGISFDIA